MNTELKDKLKVLINDLVNSENVRVHKLVDMLELCAKNDYLINDFYKQYEKKYNVIKDYVMLCRKTKKKYNSRQLQKINPTLVSNIYRHFGGFENFKSCVVHFRQTI